ncbi:MAG: transaldolase [Candidatus Acidiferrum sp.]
MKSISDLQVKIFGDGADIASILELSRKPFIKGFTTNPTLMRKAGVPDYASFAALVLQQIPDRPVSFEVLADDAHTMERQARYMATWGPNVYVKIPVTNTKRQPLYGLIQRLSQEGIQINVTAVFTLEQVRQVARALEGGASSNVSIFAGRIADTGRDPLPIMRKTVDILRNNDQCELIWASPRELLNIFQADAIGCHIITVTSDILKKLDLVGKDLDEFSLETVKMFYDDGVNSGYTLEPNILVERMAARAIGGSRRRGNG